MSIRTSLSKYRPGVGGTVSISPAWLTVSSGGARGGPQVFTRSGLEVPVVAWLRLSNHLDVQVGDVLRCELGAQAQGRLFVVRQISPNGRHQILACGELFAIIPDEMESGVVESWWVASSADFNPTLGGGYLVVNLPNVGGVLPGSGCFLFQSVAGNFDIWGKLEHNGSGGANRYGFLLGIRVGASGTYIGQYWDGLAAQVARLDDVAGVVTASPYPGTFSYYRLRRQGNNILVYYSAATDDPTQESDWVPLLPSNTPPTLTGTASIGLCGYRVGAKNDGTCYFIRNWN